ncbi:MAG: leucine zipper domain-containing protein [Phenylobacterium sp.]|uniref:leucine zipper domain-containing protein n=1 Tax=Phenylobacterium sp. TaxID=1871053 RepID=UPI00273446CF|nr:leucine zipper domain-containing protein [Phenylobacterium sp.]MDP3749695.1 leucine zipper domain-containing protein [Phenylobacterium sp.]
MNIDRNARLTPLGREAMIRRIEEDGWPVARAAEAPSRPQLGAEAMSGPDAKKRMVFEATIILQK